MEFHDGRYSSSSRSTSRTMEMSQRKDDSGQILWIAEPPVPSCMVDRRLSLDDVLCAVDVWETALQQWLPRSSLGVNCQLHVWLVLGRSGKVSAQTVGRETSLNAVFLQSWNVGKWISVRDKVYVFGWAEIVSGVCFVHLYVAFGDYSCALN